MRQNRGFKISLAIVLVLLIVPMTFTRLDAQNDTSRLAISIRANVHWPIQRAELGNVQLRFFPAPSWEVNISYDFLRSSRVTWMISYQRGSLPVWMRVFVPAGLHPDIPYELNFPLYYAQHPYNSLGVGVRRTVGTKAISIHLANRFYSSSHAGAGIKVHLQPTQIINAFEADTRFSRRYFCPQLVLGLSGQIWHRIPSWNYEINIAIAPVRVVTGEYIFFQNDQALKSAGTFRVRQSNISIGLVYRRVKKAD
jgi:hypothetical protein